MSYAAAKGLFSPISKGPQLRINVRKLPIYFAAVDPTISMDALDKALNTRPNPNPGVYYVMASDVYHEHFDNVARDVISILDYWLNIQEPQSPSGQTLTVKVNSMINGQIRRGLLNGGMNCISNYYYTGDMIWGGMFTSQHGNKFEEMVIFDDVTNLHVVNPELLALVAS